MEFLIYCETITAAAELIITVNGGSHILYGMDEAGAVVSLDRIREMEQGFNEKYECPPVSLSLGASTATNGGEICAALKKADERMYADKLARKKQRE